MIRYNFNTRNQRPGAGFELYCTEQRNTLKDCEFGSLEDNMWILVDKACRFTDFWNITSL